MRSYKLHHILHWSGFITCVAVSSGVAREQLALPEECRPTATFDGFMRSIESHDPGCFGESKTCLISDDLNSAGQAISFAPSLHVTLDWESSVFGTAIGVTGLHVVDLDGDGKQEILASAALPGLSGNLYWYILEKIGDRFEMVWISPILDVSINSLRVANMDDDDDLDVIVGAGNRLMIYDGSTRLLMRVLSTTATSIRGLRIVDVDSDGGNEFVFCDSDELFIYDTVTGFQKACLSGYGGLDLDVGNVDGDPDKEIVIGNDDLPGYVLNGTTLMQEWIYNEGFGRYVRLGDVDGDGIQELVAGYSFRYVRAFDLDLQSARYDLDMGVSFRADALQLYDIEGDGAMEIVFGGTQGHGIHVHNGETGVEKWQIDSTYSGATDIAFGDADNDGANEILWGVGHHSTGPDYLYVYDAATNHALEWQSMDIQGPFYGLDHGDIDNDGHPELIYASYESKAGGEDGVYFIHDALTHSLEYTSSSSTGLAWTGLWRIRHANIDADPQSELFVAKSLSNRGRLYCYDGISHSLQWSRILDAGHTIRSLEIADIDGDGTLEIVAGAGREAGGVLGSYVYVIDAVTGTTEWRSTNIGSAWASLALLRLANTDLDANLELIVADTEGGLWVFDGVTHEMQTPTINIDITSLETFDLDQNGIDEIIIAGSNGVIQVVSPQAGVTATLGDYRAPVNGLRIVDLLPGGSLELVYVLQGRLCVRSMNGPLLWASENLTPMAGANDSVMVADIDGDGKTEIVVNTAIRGVRVYEVPAPEISFETNLNTELEAGSSGLTPLH